MLVWLVGWLKEYQMSLALRIKFPYCNLNQQEAQMKFTPRQSPLKKSLLLEERMQTME